MSTITKMKVVILGAGYGTRMGRDLKNDATGQYQHLINIPKPLLPIGTDPLITHWAKSIGNILDIEDIYVVTNETNHAAFEEWSKLWPNVKLVCDGSTSNENRSGAVSCMNLTVSHFKVQDYVIIIAGDTLFRDDFQLSDYINKFNKFLAKDPEANMLLYVTCSDEEVHKYGILETNDEHRVTGFLEKPQPQETTSRKECPCFYFLNKSSLSLLSQFLEEKKDEPLKARDATGNFIAYLHKIKPVYAVEISGRFDVGGLDTYIKCHEYFLKAK